MLSDGDIELAHPESFDFAFGNLAAAERPGFNRHLSSCRHCRSVVDEYGDIGAVIKTLPPHAEPSADLRDRTVAAMVAVLAGQRAKPAARPAGPSAEDNTTRPYPVPQLGPPAGPEARAAVSRRPAWRRYQGRLAAVVAIAAAVITAAIVLPISLPEGRVTPAQAAVVIPLHATTAARLDGDGAATGRATARQNTSGSWTISLTVSHLKSFGDSQWYTCWYLSRNGQVTSAGTFLVRDSRSWTFPMTSAADPHDFRTMEITLGPPGNNGELAGPVILSGQAL